jgi:hypothetical protein
MYMGTGGDPFFEPGTAEVAINNETGVAALEMLKALVEYSNPDFLTFDSNATQALWEGGQLAWRCGARAAAASSMTKAPRPKRSSATPFSPARRRGRRRQSRPRRCGGTASPSRQHLRRGCRGDLHRDGATGSATRCHGQQRRCRLAEPMATNPAAASPVSRHRAAGARPYPMLPFMGLMHTALGNELTEFLQGRRAPSRRWPMSRRPTPPRPANRASCSKTATNQGARALGPAPPAAPPRHRPGEQGPCRTRPSLVHPALAGRDDPVHRAAHRLGRVQSLHVEHEQVHVDGPRTAAPSAALRTETTVDRRRPRRCARNAARPVQRARAPISTAATSPRRGSAAAWAERTAVLAISSRQLYNLPFYKALAFTLTYTFVVTPLGDRAGLAIALGVNGLPRMLKGPTIFVSLLPMIVTPLIGLAGAVLDDRRRRRDRQDAADPLRRSRPVAQGLAGADLDHAARLRGLVSRRPSPSSCSTPGCRPCPRTRWRRR